MITQMGNKGAVRAVTAPTFWSIFPVFVSNAGVEHFLHSAEEIFEKNLFLTKLWPFKLSDDATISDFHVVARKLRIFQ